MVSPQTRRRENVVHPMRKRRLPVNDYDAPSESGETVMVAASRDMYTRPQWMRIRQGHARHRPVTMTYSCLLIPMFLAAWWYWTRRKARRVVAGFLRYGEAQDSDEDVSPTNSDDFSTWEEVMENESRDPSVRFVRWIKANDIDSSARRRASVKQASMRTIRVLSTQSIDSDLTETFADEYQFGPSRWQCLHDTEGIEMCAMESSYEDLERLDGRMRPSEKDESYHSELLCTP